MTNGGGWWVGRNDTARFPNRFIIIDSEAVRTPDKRGEVQTFRCAVAAAVARDTNDAGWGPPRWAEFDSAAGLWDWVSRKAGGRGRTVVVAHNVSYDAQLTAAMTELPALRWQMEPPSITPDRLVLRFRRGSARIMLIDSLQWLPKALDAIGEAIGRPKRPLPDDDAEPEVWLERCRRDVEILLEAWMRLMGWVQAEDLGTWQPTGAGMALTLWRHRHLTHRVLIHWDRAAREAEREAAWCGRAEAWKWGAIPGGPFTEWDLKAAYGTVMAECEVPTVYRRHVEAPTLKAVLWARRRAAVLARVSVTTEVPCVPVRGPQGVLWPVGRFDTTLWGEEWDLVEASGGTVTIHEMWVYDRAPALASFARWALAVIDAPAGTVDPVAQIAVKHFTRALAGKFGARYWDWVDIGESPEADGRLGRLMDVDTRTTGRYLSLHGRFHVQGPLTDSDKSCPQILSWIQAQTRVRLWAAMAAVGPGHLAYVDTDGIIVDRAGSRIMEGWADERWRPKGRFEELEILAPRRIVTDGRLRAAGIPKGAVPVGGNRWEADIWRNQVQAFAQGDDGRVVIKKRLYKLGVVDNRRRHLPGGTTEAIRVDWVGPA